MELYTLFWCFLEICIIHRRYSWQLIRISSVSYFKSWNSSTSKADKCVVIYGRSTNLSGPVRMALRGLLIALLGKPQRRFCAIEYIRAVKRSTVPVAVVRSAVQREFGGSRSLRCSLSRRFSSFTNACNSLKGRLTALHSE